MLLKASMDRLIRTPSQPLRKALEDNQPTNEVPASMVALGSERSQSALGYPGSTPGVPLGWSPWGVPRGIPRGSPKVLADSGPILNRLWAETESNLYRFCVDSGWLGESRT